MLDKAYRWILLAPTLLPLLYVEGVMYPLMAPKTFLLRTSSLLALSLLVYFVGSGKSFFWQRLSRPVTWIPGVLVGIAYIASFIGVDFYHSFWSTFERGDGLLTLTLCVSYFYLILLSADEKFMGQFVRLVSWVGSLTAIYVVLQWIVVTGGFETSLFVPANGRVGGTMGNAAFLAAYLGMALCITGIARQYYHGTKRTYLYIGAGFQVLAILLAATRGTLLALLIVAGIALVYFALKGAGEAKGRARKGLAILAVLFVLFGTFRSQLAQVPFEPISRLASISLSDATVSSRLFVWSNVARATTERFFTGYGAEHIDVLFNRVYDPSLLVEEWFDRSHNAYLDYLVQFGIFGLLAFIALLAALLHTGVRLFKRGDSFGPWILGFVGIYAVQNFFVFDTGVTFWFLLATTAIAFAREKVGESEVVEAGSVVVSWVLAIGLLLLIIPVSVRPLFANLKAFEAYRYQIVDVVRSEVAFKNGLEWGTYADLEYGYNAYFMYTDTQRTLLSGKDLVIAYNTTKSLLQQAYDRYPYDARTALYFAQVLADAPSGVAVDPELLSGAVARTIELSPKRVQPWFILTNLAIDDANKFPPGSVGRKAGYAAAKDILKKYMGMVPNLSEPHFVLAQLDLATDDRASAAKEAELGKTLYKGDLKSARRAVAYYVSVSEWESARYFLNEIAEQDPHDYASLFDYAKVTYVLGDHAKAAELVARLRVEQPDILNTDQEFMAAIKEYESRASGGQRR